VADRRLSLARPAEHEDIVMMGKASLAMLLCFACVGCAPTARQDEASGGDADGALAQSRAARCFRVSTIDNWRVIDERQLVVYGPGRSAAWHLRLFAPCQGLRFTETLGFRAAGTDWICGDPGDIVVWRENRCAISAVRPVSPAQAKLLFDGNVRDDIGRVPADAPATGNRKEE
jgi:hypothetical protein